MGLIRKKGFSYGFNPDACRKCPGKCCRGSSGNIWISDRELQEICRFLGTNPIDVLRKYVVQVNNRLSLRERYVDSSYDCIFFDRAKNRCAIYEVRPEQCRSFPFWTGYADRLQEIMAECPGIEPVTPDGAGSEK